MPYFKDAPYQGVTSLSSLNPFRADPDPAQTSFWKSNWMYILAAIVIVLIVIGYVAMKRPGSSESFTPSYY